jgi:uncharacterized protein
MPPRLGAPDLGIGLGLRVPHYRHILAELPQVDFFEIISENFMLQGGNPLRRLEQFQSHYRLIQHGVSLGIGGPDALDSEYLARLKQLTQRVNPPWLSDHLCWTGLGQAHLHDLLPLPYTQEMVKRVVERARRVQDFLGVRFALENTSSYMAYRQSEMTEWQFLSEIAEQADIGIMLDVNNVYVSAYNHGFDAYTFIRNLPHERVVQMHLAGHTNLGKYLLDTHNGDIIEPVWDLYRACIELTGPVSTLIEWDDEIPEFSVLAALSETARKARAEALVCYAARSAGVHGPSFVTGRELLPGPQHSAGNSAALGDPYGCKQGGPRERGLEAARPDELELAAESSPGDNTP